MQTWRVIYYIQVHWSNSAWELSVSCSDLSRGRELPQTMPQGQPPAVTTCPQNCVSTGFLPRLYQPLRLGDLTVLSHKGIVL